MKQNTCRVRTRVWIDDINNISLVLPAAAARAVSACSWICAVYEGWPGAKGERRDPCLSLSISSECGLVGASYEKRLRSIPWFASFAF